MGKLSPMMQQYLDIKAAHKDHVVFFRVGDFYEMFFDDALEISKVLELTLTGKDCGLEERAPMCGIPYHASATYIKRLIDRGYKVAICEQVEDPATAKGLVKRDIIRLVTPGTVIEGDLLEEAKNNYLASVCLGDDSFAVCFADVSTGEAKLTLVSSSSSAADLMSELSKFVPTELLVDAAFLQSKELTDFSTQKLHAMLSTYEGENLNPAEARSCITNHFQVAGLEELKLPEDPLVEQALGMLILYLNQTQKDGALRIKQVEFYQPKEYMEIDLTARRNLEIVETMRSKEKRGTLLWVLDQTKTSMGKRLMRKSLEQPLLNVAKITRRQNAVAELSSQPVLLDDLREQLSGVYDLERLMTRVIYQSASPKDLRALSATARRLPSIRQALSSAKSEELRGIFERIDEMEDVANLVENAIVENPPFLMKDGGYIQDGFNQTLDELRHLCSNAKGIIEELEASERERTGIRNLKIKYNRVFGYYIEVTNSFLSQVPEEYIRKQTTTNSERFITHELKELENRILTSSEKILALEAEIFREVRGYIATRTDAIQQTADALALLDVLASLADVAIKNKYVCPQIVPDGRIRIKNGRHPVVEQMIDLPFVPNDLELDEKDHRIMVITGPNMAGKSTYMRQTALLVIMAQIGSFVPASSAEIGIVDRIFTRVGASDDLAAGQSTFMVEMSEVAHILKHATPHSLVILDEIGRGTSTFDGMSIAKAVVEYLATNRKLRCKTLFATHYHELTSLEEELPGILNYNIAVKKRGDDITFLRKIVRGGADDSYGIEVAKLAGVPDKVVSRAKEILKQLIADGLVIREAPKLEESDQATFSTYSSPVEEIIKNTAMDTLTPLEALNLLYELKKKLTM